jgi:uncharacterized protein (TIGR02594 family)
MTDTVTISRTLALRTVGVLNDVVAAGGPRTPLLDDVIEVAASLAVVTSQAALPTMRIPTAPPPPAPPLPPLPPAYAWLDGHVGLSRLLVEARATIGVLEVKGRGNNPVILAWAAQVGLASVYHHDETAWCGLAMAVWARRAGWDVVKDPLWARNWANFGRRVEEDDAALGDVLVFSRAGGGGHVGLYVGEDDHALHVLGGNQGDAVSIVRIAKDRLIAVRRPKWKVSQPPGVVKVRLRASGQLSENEA